MSESYSDEHVIDVDLADVLRDEALKAMPDGPAKRFLTRLSYEADYNTAHPPVVVVKHSRPS